jgi:hypothetical protein
MRASISKGCEVNHYLTAATYLQQRIVCGAVKQQPTAKQEQQVGLVQQHGILPAVNIKQFNLLSAAHTDCGTGHGHTC